MSAVSIFKGWIALCIFFFLLPGRSVAQVSARFSASTTSGCAPVVVQYKDLSAGSPTSWRWDLGNGVVSQQQHPSTTYFNPGTYSIKLVVRSASGADSVLKQEYITVHPNPQVEFSASDSTGCFPLLVSFTEKAAPAAGTITSRIWDFGDGTTSKEANPVHRYRSEGTFTVALKVTNSFGCTKTITRPAYIKTTAGIKGSFTYTGPGPCALPAKIRFTNTTGGGGALTYRWDFGDGTQSALKNPEHTYTKEGAYTVTLIASNTQGCTDTVSAVGPLFIGLARAQFKAPDTACAGQPVTFLNATSPRPESVTWKFGDETAATGFSPVKTYRRPGTYTVTMIARFENCSDTLSRNIVVREATPLAFSSEVTASCRLPFQVQFRNTSSGTGTYKWLFGDGSAATGKEPLHTYTASGVYSVSLIHFNSNGCSDTLTRTEYIRVQKPVITFKGLPKGGCVPLAVRPVADIETVDSVTSYFWQFGDGSSSTDRNPVHTYTAAGTYTVSLRVVTAGGCVDSLVLPAAVRAGNKPDAQFSALPPDVCAGDPVAFRDESTGNPDRWFWNFGDGDSSSAQNPQHLFQGLGKFSVTLIVSSNTCADTIRIRDVVNVRPPLARFYYNENCTDRYRKDFRDGSSGATTWFWDFGDGHTSTERNPSHKFAAKGVYKVVLTVTNKNCASSNWVKVKVLDEKAFFTSEDAVCKETSTRFASKGIDGANIARWQWNFGDGNTATKTGEAEHVYAKAGTYTVALTITDSIGCADTWSKTIRVHGPQAGFRSSVAGVCLENNSVTFTDTSKGDGIHPVTAWQWSFGDGSRAVAPLTVHSYKASGEYAVTLRVTDSFGCSDSLSAPRPVIIAQPKASFLSPDTLSCTDKPVRFSNASTGYDLRYRWLLGDGATSGEAGPVHAYRKTGTFGVQLAVTDRFGCTDTLTRPAYIHISYPKARFSVSDSFGTCPPLRVQFTNSSAHYSGLKWDFGDGNTSILEHPEHYYTIPGVYEAILVVTGPGGCTDTARQRIEVRGPKGRFDYTPLTGCVPLSVQFKATVTDGASLTWDFSNGITETGTSTGVRHVYDEAGTYVPKMILTDASGCRVAISGRDTIRAVGIQAGFTKNKDTLCGPGNIRFLDASLSNDYITGYRWSFGDGGTSSGQHPVHRYEKVGVYTVQLIATTAMGCSDTLALRQGVTLFDGPVITLGGDSAGCAPASLQFRPKLVSGGVPRLDWSWSLGDGTVSTQRDPAHIYKGEGTYTVQVVVRDANGCTDTASRAVAIHAVPVTSAGPDLKLCAGSPIRLSATGADFYTWSGANLSCTDCSDPVARPSDTTRYVVTGRSQFGCSSRDTVQVLVRPPFVLRVSRGDTICAGETSRIWAAGADGYTWSPATGLDRINGAQAKAAPVQTTVYQVIGRDRDGCFADTATVRIHVNALPKVEAGADLTMSAGTPVQLKGTASPDVVSWKWTPAQTLSCADCPAPKAAPRQTTKYGVTVTNEGGCTGTDDVTVSVICNNGNFFLPNTFTPNGNGKNDRFYPRGTGISMIRSLRIYNRWGELVFERMNFNANDAASGWDGTYKGRSLTSDVFVYTCEVVCVNNEVLPFKGDVTLLK